MTSIQFQLYSETMNASEMTATATLVLKFELLFFYCVSTCQYVKFDYAREEAAEKGQRCGSRPEASTHGMM